MDKLVNRVTLVRGSGRTREAKTVYESSEEDFPTIPIDPIVRSVTVIEGGEEKTAKVVFKSRTWSERKPSWELTEETMRRFLKADVIRAQETYREHLHSANFDKRTWWLDLPVNMVRAFLKADYEVRKNKRSKEIGDAMKDVQSDLRDLKDDIEAAASDTRKDGKTKASEAKSKAKGT